MKKYFVRNISRSYLCALISVCSELLWQREATFILLESVARPMIFLNALTRKLCTGKIGKRVILCITNISSGQMFVPDHVIIVLALTLRWLSVRINVIPYRSFVPISKHPSSANCMMPRLHLAIIALVVTAQSLAAKCHGTRWAAEYSWYALI